MMVVMSLRLLGIATAIKYASLTVLLSITIWDLLLWTVQSVVMHLTQYTL